MTTTPSSQARSAPARPQSPQSRQSATSSPKPSPGYLRARWTTSVSGPGCSCPFRLAGPGARAVPGRPVRPGRGLVHPDRAGRRRPRRPSPGSGLYRRPRGRGRTVGPRRRAPRHPRRPGPRRPRLTSPPTALHAPLRRPHRLTRHPKNLQSRTSGAPRRPRPKTLNAFLCRSPCVVTARCSS